jgi:hypothetical protein
VLAAPALTAYSAVESASWITPAPSVRHQLSPLVSQGAPCLIFWAREGCNRILMILVDTERLVSLLVSFVSVHYGPGYGSS